MRIGQHKISNPENVLLGKLVFENKKGDIRKCRWYFLVWRSIYYQKY